MEDLPLEEIQAFEKLIGKDQANMPNRKEMLEILAGSNFTEETKEKIKSLLIGDVPTIFGSGGFLAFVFVFIIVAIIIFFGYKLYKSIKDKEIKREEKKKAKMSKKKK